MTQNNSRQTIVDEIRGISLLGILLANMLIFQYGIWGKDELFLFQITSADHALYSFIKIFIEGSFMPIFTFLFGFGMVKMMDGLISKGIKHRRVLLRRSFMLMVLGFAHSMFLWEGDILFFYGLLSLFLLLFLKRKARTILIWGIVLLTLIGVTSIRSSDPINNELISKEKTVQYVANSIDIYQNGSYKEILKFRNDEEAPIEASGFMLAILVALIPLLTAPMFLFGMYAAKKNWFLHPHTKRAFYARWAIIFLPLGLIMKSLKYVWPNFILSGTGEITGMSLLALGYIMGFSWLLSLGKAASLRNGFEAVGRLSLTNYLMQTVICTTLFYGYGLGWFGKLGVLAGIGLSIAIYTLQLAFSSFYLKHFRIGPIERLLRIWTYWSWRGNAKSKRKRNTAQPDTKLSL